MLILKQKIGILGYGEVGKAIAKFYKKLKMPHVIRPVLYPPKNSIGGHCIVPNMEALSKIFKSKALELINDYR